MKTCITTYDIIRIIYTRIYTERGAVMATLMQKDVLLEGVFQALGYAHRANADEAAINELWELKEKLYSSRPEDLDFKGIMAYIKKTIETYRGQGAI